MSANHPGKADQLASGGNVSRQLTFCNKLTQHLRERAEHVIAGARTPRLARSTAWPHQIAATQLDNQIVDVASGQILSGKPRRARSAPAAGRTRNPQRPSAGSCGANATSQRKPLRR
jgi:hypothetical protein